MYFKQTLFSSRIGNLTTGQVYLLLSCTRLLRKGEKRANSPWDCFSSEKFWVTSKDAHLLLFSRELNLVYFDVTETFLLEKQSVEL